MSIEHANAPVGLALMALLVNSSVWAEVRQPDGYRTERYDDAVPAALDGATRVSALELVALQARGDVAIIDVIPEIRRPPDLPEGHHWMPLTHRGLPGALWLPDVGYGSLSATTERYFRRHLKAATGGTTALPLVFYCRMDCWMSWNAAKRALSYGYTSVYWFADGIDDWLFEDLPLVELAPAPGQRQAGDKAEVEPRNDE